MKLSLPIHRPGGATLIAGLIVITCIGVAACDAPTTANSKPGQNDVEAQKRANRDLTGTETPDALDLELVKEPDLYLRGEKALKAHKLYVAMAATNLMTAEQRRGPRFAALKAGIDREWKATTPVDDDPDAYSIRENLQADLDKLPKAAPSALPDIAQRVQFFDDTGLRLKDTLEIKLTPKQRAIRDHFVAALEARQTADLPKLRAAFAKNFSQNLWKDDVKVGSSGRTLKFEGGVFAANANKATMEDQVAQMAMKMRFNRIEYRWYSGDEGSAYYTLKVPADNAVGYWEGTTFVSTK